MMILLSLVLSLFAGTAVAGTDQAVKDVEQTLDHFHQAAAKADGAAYFALFAPDGVFLGTDASERWTVDEFKKYALARFAKGHGWTYVPKERHVTVAPSGDVAWFDELLVNEHLGTCRGSGVLRRLGGAWRISQYNLSIPVPNGLADKVVGMIRQTP